MSCQDPIPEHVRGLCRLMQGDAQHLVEVHETHISWVLVGERLAYKLRKRIMLPFLDFSSIEARRQDCEREVSLNRRWAPDLYLGVVAIHGTDAQPAWKGAKPAIDHMVCMRRLPKNALMKDRLADGLVGPNDMALLARTIADVHHSAPIVGRDKVGDVPELVSTQLMMVLDQLQQGAVKNQDRRWFARVRAWAENELDRARPLMAQRVECGRFRDCHGDLHLGNVAWFDGAWLLFDGIEFDDALRHLDVMSDLAFLTMDLKVHGRLDLAFALLNAYLEHTGDHEGVKLLRLYEVYRALVRLLVAYLSPSSAGETPDMSGADAYSRFIEDASGTAQASDWGHLVLMHGLSGSGKSFVSSEIAMKLPAIRVRSDVERKRSFGLRPHQDSSALALNIYTPQANERTLQRLALCAEWALEGGWSVIVDATFLRRKDREQFHALAHRCGCEVVIVHCEADLETLHKRVRSRRGRGGDASEATEAVLRAQLALPEPLTPQEKANAITVCTEWRIRSVGIEMICHSISGR